MSEDVRNSRAGGGRKPLMIGLAAGLLAGGAAVAAYFLLLRPAGPAADKPVAAAPDAATASASAAATYVKLDRLSAPLLADNIVMGYVLLDLSLEVKNKSDELAVVQKLPALRAAFLRAVTETPIGKPDQPLVVDFASLTARLQDTANRELGKPLVKRVLVVQTTRI